MSRFVPLAAALRDAKVFSDGDWVESKDQDQNGEVRLTQLADVGDGYWINKSNRFMTHEKAARLKCTFLEPGDVLVARMPEPLGRSCIFPGDTKPCVTVVDVCVMRPNNEILDSRYLMHAINSPFSRHGIAQHITGTTRKRISRRNLGKVTIFLPPLPEQKHIAAILDAADSLRVKRRESIEQLDSLIQSTFLEMFGDPVTNPKGWETVELRELGSLNRGVSTHRPRNEPRLLGGDHPLIQTGDVAKSGGYIRTCTASYSDLGLQQSKKWPAGTLCITIAANIASTGILTFESCFPDSVVGFLPGQKSRVEYVHGVIQSLQKILDSKATQVAQKNINLQTLRSLVVQCPPLDLQTRFASIVESIEHQKTLLKSHLAELDTLFASLQSRAFSGELVA